MTIASGGVFIAVRTSAWPPNPKAEPQAGLDQNFWSAPLRAKTTVPILLPARLPSGIKEAEIQHVDIDVPSGKQPHHARMANWVDGHPKRKLDDALVSESDHP